MPPIDASHEPPKPKPDPRLVVDARPLPPRKLSQRTPPSSSADTKQQPKHRRRTLKRALIGSGALAIMVAASLTIALRPKPSVLPADIVNAAGFPLFAPAGLSNEYKIDPASAQFKQGILVYSLSLPGGKKVAITQQAKPEQLSRDLIEGTKEFRTLYGDAIVLDFPDETLGDLVTEKSWVLISAKEPIGTAEMEKLLNSMQPLR